MTRIKENGWPKTRGLLRRKKVITEEAIITATQDAIRIAITIGGSLPDIAKAIAITCMDATDAPLSRETVEKWIDDSSLRGDDKIVALSESYPEWLRFCSITAASSNGDFEYFEWRGIHEVDDAGSPILTIMYSQGTALALIAMCWTLRHPGRAEFLFENPASTEVIPTDLQYLVGGPQIYSGWLHMAEILVTRYSKEIGFPKYENLA